MENCSKKPEDNKDNRISDDIIYSVCNSERNGYSDEYASSEWKINDELSVRPITLEDTPHIVKWRNDPDVKHNFIYQKPFTDESHNEWMRTKVFTGQVRQFILEMMPERIPVGSVYLQKMDWNKREAEYGIFIGDSRALHHGFGSLGAEWCAAYAKKEMHIEHLVVRIYADNPASLAACEHAGYRITEKVDNYVCIDGKWRDIYFMINDL